MPPHVSYVIYSTVLLKFLKKKRKKKFYSVRCILVLNSGFCLRSKIMQVNPLWFNRFEYIESGMESANYVKLQWHERRDPSLQVRQTTKVQSEIMTRLSITFTSSFYADPLYLLLVALTDFLNENVTCEICLFTC